MCLCECCGHPLESAGRNAALDVNQLSVSCEVKEGSGVPWPYAHLAQTAVINRPRFLPIVTVRTL